MMTAWWRRWPSMLTFAYVAAFASDRADEGLDAYRTKGRSGTALRDDVHVHS